MPGQNGPTGGEAGREESGAFSNQHSPSWLLSVDVASFPLNATPPWHNHTDRRCVRFWERPPLGIHDIRQAS